MTAAPRSSCNLTQSQKAWSDNGTASLAVVPFPSVSIHDDGFDITVDVCSTSPHSPRARPLPSELGLSSHSHLLSLIWSNPQCSNLINAREMCFPSPIPVACDSVISVLMTCLQWRHGHDHECSYSRLRWYYLQLCRFHVLFILASILTAYLVLDAYWKLILQTGYNYPSSLCTIMVMCSFVPTIVIWWMFANMRIIQLLCRTFDVIFLMGNTVVWGIAQVYVNCAAAQEFTVPHCYRETIPITVVLTASVISVLFMDAMLLTVRYRIVIFIGMLIGTTSEIISTRTQTIDVPADWGPFHTTWNALYIDRNITVFVFTLKYLYRIVRYPDRMVMLSEAPVCQRVQAQLPP